MKTSVSLALLLTGVSAALLPYPAARAQLTSSRYTVTTIADNTTNPLFANFSPSYPAINDNGVVAFRVIMPDGSDALYSSVNGVLTQLVSTTDTTGLFTGFTDNTLAINSNGTIVFAGTTTVGGTSTPAIFAVNQAGGPPVPIVTGASDPVDLGVQLLYPTINDAGQVIFEAKGTKNATTGAQLGGYFEVNAAGGTPVAVYQSGNNSQLYPPIINASGQVAFIIDPGVPASSGDADPGQQVWRIDSPGATPTVLAAVGQNSIADFVDNATLSTLQVDIDATGKVVYNATLTDNTEGIYFSTGTGDMETFLTTSSSEFSLLASVAYGKSGAVDFFGVSPVSSGTFDGTDPSSGYVLSTADGYYITSLSEVFHDQVNANGQLVFTYSAMSTADDSLYGGILVATPNTAGGSPTPSPTGSAVVTISPATAKTYENGGALKLIVSRTGDTSAALTVAYVAKGSAVAGSNYKKLSGTVVIPAGSASALLKIKIKDDHIDDGTVVLKVVLSASDSYTLGTGTVSKIKILNADH